MQPHQFLGYWISPNNEIFIDVVNIYVSKATAMIVAYMNGETSIYGFTEDKIFYIEKEKYYEKVTSSEAFSQPEAVQEGH